MIPALEAADVVKALIGHLAGELGVPVSAKTPNPRPDEFVTITEIGGTGTVDVVRFRSTVRFHAWAQSLPEARKLVARAHSVIRATRGRTVGGVLIGRVEDVSGLIVMPDPESEQPRYAGTVDVWSRMIRSA